MDQSIACMQTELEANGYQPMLLAPPHVPAVVFDYRIESGSHAGETFSIGISGTEGAYPEYPPHWVHISQPISDGQLAHGQYQVDGKDGLPISRPPKDSWYQRKERNMTVYLSDHLRRIWKDV